jgi:hypothetical protein
MKTKTLIGSETQKITHGFQWRFYRLHLNSLMWRFYYTQVRYYLRFVEFNKTTLQSIVVIICTMCSNVQQHSAHANCVYVFRMVLTVNNDPAGLCSGDVMCSLWGTNWICIYYLDEFSDLKWQLNYTVRIFSQANKTRGSYSCWTQYWSIMAVVLTVAASLQTNPAVSPRLQRVNDMQLCT